MNWSLLGAQNSRSSYYLRQVDNSELKSVEKGARYLEQLNSLPPNRAEEELLHCCGSREWALRMVKERPFADLPELISRAKSIWFSLQPRDWLEAFLSHPKIGESHPAGQSSARARNWSEQEQSGTKYASPDTLHSLADLNSKYEKKFGHIFIVCATGKSSEQMLATVRQRLNNDPVTELGIAEAEQFRITQIRLEKLVN